MLHFEPIININEDLVIASIKGTLCDVTMDNYILYDVEEFNPDVDLLQLKWVMQHVVARIPAELLIKYSREFEL